MSAHDSYYNQLPSPQAGPPPPPPPKSYSQLPGGRSDTPSAHPSPAPPPPPPPHPSQFPYQQQQQQQQQQVVQPPQTQPTYIRSPPPVPYSPPPQTQSSPQPAYQTQNPSSLPYNTQPQIHPTPPHLGTQQPQPQFPSTFILPEKITSHTTTDLASLLTKPDVLSYLATQHPAYAESTRPIQSQIASNLALAQQISSLEAQVKALRDQTGQSLLQHTSLQTQWRRKQSEMDEALAPWGPRAMYQRLVAGIGEQEALLRAMYESFLDGGNDPHDFDGRLEGKATEKDVNDWIKRIREGTVTLEKRKEVKSRWDEGRVGGWR